MSMRKYSKHLRVLSLGVLLLRLLISTNSVAARPTLVAPLDLTAIDTYVAREQQVLGIPGIAMALVQGDQIIHFANFGRADETGRAVTSQTPFRLGSLSKSFTALAVMQLVEQGKIDLDAPVQRYLPWFRVADEAASRQMTVRNLLNHTSGISTLTGNSFWGSQAGLEAAVRQLQTVQLTAPVGTRYQYSNVNYTIAGLIVEKVSGQPYADYVTQHIFGPLQMHHAYTDTAAAVADGLAVGHTYRFGRLVADAGVQPPAILPAGFLIASTEDLAHYAIAQLNGGRYGATAVLSAQGIAALHRPAVPNGEQDSFYDMGWVSGPINGVPTVWHNGDDARFHTMLILVPERQWGIVLLANASGFDLTVGIDDIAHGVLGLLVGQAPPTFSPARIVFRTIYWGVLSTPFLLLLGIVRGWRRWRSGYFANPTHDPHHGRQVVGRLLLTVVINLAVAYIFLFGFQQVTGLPLFTAFRILNPDFAYALIAGGVLALGWSIVYPALAWFGLRKPVGHVHTSLIQLRTNDASSS